MNVDALASRRLVLWLSALHKTTINVNGRGTLLSRRLTTSLVTVCHSAMLSIEKKCFYQRKNPLWTLIVSLVKVDYYNRHILDALTLLVQSRVSR